MKSFRLSAILIAIGLLFAMFGAMTNRASAQDYCKPSYYYAGNYMWITSVEMTTEDGTMSNSTGATYSPGYTFYDNYKTMAKGGDQVDFVVKFSNTYPMEMAIYVDWDQNGQFSKAEMMILTSSSQSTGGYQGYFTVPDDAKAGTTRMRVMTEYSYQNAPSDPCYQYYYYGECEDYVFEVLPSSPDAEVIAVTSPAKPWRIGTLPVSVTLRSNNRTTMKDCKLDWWINDVFQGTFNWTGTLEEGKTTTVTLGNYNFDYPAGGPWGPFEVKVQTRIPNGFDPDANPGNDIFTGNVTPILNDAGVIGFFGPPEGFGPGVTQVRARIRNYAPKTLTSVTINWKMDGVDQTPVTLTGLNIKRDEYADVVLGTYNFYAKTPLGPFSVECVSSMPNGVADEDPSNDKYVGGIGPSLAAGYYYIGPTNSQFSSPAEAASYINSSGVFGPGKVTFEVRPGTYTGQVVLNSPLPNKNEIEFIGGSNFPENVVLAANTTPQNNFVILLDGLDNVTFRNLTIRNNNSVGVGAGIIVSANNINGLNFYNVNFMGVANSPRSNPGYALLNLANCKPVTVSHCNFTGGSAGFYSVINSGNSPTINVRNSNFSNFSWIGVHNQIAANVMGAKSDLSFNKFDYISGTVPVGGIATWNSGSVVNNDFSGINGTGSLSEAVIYVNYASQSTSNPAEVSKNTIVGCSNINGIYVSGPVALVDKNYVNITQTSNYGYSLIRAENTRGAVGNNQLAGTNIYGLNVINSPMLDVLYNSINTQSSAYPTVLINNAGRIWRNIFMNRGTAAALQVGAFNSSNQNIFYTNGGTLISDNGVARDLESWQDKGNDKDSETEFIEFINEADLHIKIYTGSILFGTPLFSSADGYPYTVESSDFDGTQRTSFFGGSHEMTLEVTLIRQSEGIVNCEGSSDNYISVTSAIGYDAPMNYQWYKDGIPVPGANEPILFFNDLKHHQAGLYHARIGGPGTTPHVYSAPVAVYALRPTEITRYSENSFAENGGLATLWFEAHVNGKPIEDAIINDEVKVQWYYYIDGTNDRLLADNDKFSGVKSNYLTIRNFRVADEGEYYAVIIGQCGTVQTMYMNLELEQLSIAITEQPQNATECIGADVTLEALATTQSTKNITYQWFKGAAPLADDAKYAGTMTRRLTIRAIDADDAGDYSVTASLEGTTVSQKSANAAVAALAGPSITQDLVDTEVEEEGTIVLEVVAVSNTNEVLNYLWYFNGEMVGSGNATSGDMIVYTKENAQFENGGFYWVIVSNNCGDVESYQAEVSVVSGTTSVTDVVSGGFRLSAPAPNPVNGSAAVNYYVPVSGQVRITLTDAVGSNAIELLNVEKVSGEHTLDINSGSLNLTSGVYYLILESNGRKLMQKVSVVK